MSSLTTLLEIYAAKGWRIHPVHSIRPTGGCTCRKGVSCAQPGKHPVLAGWKDRASNDPKVLEAWANEYAHLNWGLAFDDGMIAVDLDDGGLQSWAQLQDLYGAAPAGPAQVTGSGGIHLLFSVPKGSNIKNQVKIRPGIDVRSSGGYVVVAPSTHKTGRNYSWMDLDGAVPPAPQWLLSLLTGAKPKLNFQEWLSRQPVSVSGQGGSNTCFRVACVAWEHGGIESAKEFVEAVKAWNAECSPPWSEAELEHKFNDASAKTPKQVENAVALPLRDGLPYFDDLSLLKIIETDPNFSGRLYYDSFSGQEMLDDGQVSDGRILLLKHEIMGKYSVNFLPKERLEEAVQTFLAKDRARKDVLLDYVRGLPKWDGLDRIPDLAEKCLGVDVDDQILTIEYLRCWLIALVARAHGTCKVDSMLVLRGPQGLFKSTFFRALVGDRFFSDQPVTLRSQTRDNLAKLRGVWIYEISELDKALSPETVGEVKDFLSKVDDRYREPYAKRDTTFPRRCVLVGTTNVETVLHDSTGNRRFWVISIDRAVDIDWLRANREQVLAQALALYSAGTPWWLDSESEKKQVEEVQSAREMSPELIDFLATLSATGDRVSFTSLLTMSPFLMGVSRKAISRDLREALVRSDYHRVDADTWLRGSFFVEASTKALEHGEAYVDVLAARIGIPDTREARSALWRVTRASDRFRHVKRSARWAICLHAGEDSGR